MARHLPLSKQGRTRHSPRRDFQGRMGALQRKRIEAEAIMAVRKKKWVHNVKTVSTFPPQALFTKDAPMIARTMASKKVSPKGLGSGIRMIQFFINRAGKGLSAARRFELEKAKKILQERRKREQ